jgi:hypothetical protein
MHAVPPVCAIIYTKFEFFTKECCKLSFQPEFNFYLQVIYSLQYCKVGVNYDNHPKFVLLDNKYRRSRISPMGNTLQEEFLAPM